MPAPLVPHPWFPGPPGLPGFWVASPVSILPFELESTPCGSVRFFSTLVSISFSFGVLWGPGLSFLASGSLGRPLFFRSDRIAFELESTSSVRFGFRSVPGGSSLGPGRVLKK